MTAAASTTINDPSSLAAVNHKNNQAVTNMLASSSSTNTSSALPPSLVHSSASAIAAARVAAASLTKPSNESVAAATAAAIAMKHPGAAATFQMNKQKQQQDHVNAVSQAAAAAAAVSNKKKILSAGAAAAKLSCHGNGAGSSNGTTTTSSGENTGRWTAEEHRLFLQGLEQHGKGWKKIASLIKSRTVVQIRTHAQKYFQKLAKARQNGEEGDVSMEGRHHGGHALGSGSGGQKKRRNSQLSGTKRKGISNIVASVAKDESTWPPKVAPILVPYVNSHPASSATANQTAGTKNNSNAAGIGNRNDKSESAVTSSDNHQMKNHLNLASTYEDSLYRFLTPAMEVGISSGIPMSTNSSQQQEEDKQTQSGNSASSRPNASIILPSDLPGLALDASVNGEGNSPTCVSDLAGTTNNGVNTIPFQDKTAPSWFTRGADVEDLLQDAAALDWLADVHAAASTVSSNSSSGAVVTDAESLTSNMGIPGLYSHGQSNSSSMQSMNVSSSTGGGAYNSGSNVKDGITSQSSLQHMVNNMSGAGDLSMPNLFDHGNSNQQNSSNKKLKTAESQASLAMMMSNSSSNMIISGMNMSMDDLNYGATNTGVDEVENFNVFGEADVSFDEHAFVSALLDPQTM